MRQTLLLVPSLLLVLLAANVAAQVTTVTITRPITGSVPLARPGSEFIRTAGRATYADGQSLPVGLDRPSSRATSNALFAQFEAVPSGGLTALAAFFGQFLFNDMVLDGAPSWLACAQPGGAFPVDVPTGDPYFDALSKGGQQLPYNRSSFCWDESRVAKQINAVTSHIDGSTIYGSADDVAAKLRAFTGGRLRTSVINLLPLASTANLVSSMLGCPLDGGACVATGDARGNENLAVTAIHALFVREHNRIADSIQAANASLSDEEVFQRARRTVIGELQSLAYREWLPAVLGNTCPSLSTYTTYNSNISPQINIEFADLVSRALLSALPNLLKLLSPDLTPAGTVRLAESMYASNLINTNNNILVALLNGLARQPAETVDVKFVDSVRNLFSTGVNSAWTDAAAMALQRGRDHGITSYNTLRVTYGLARKATFEEFSSNAEIVARLRATYSSVDSVDALVGGLAEQPVTNGVFGVLFATILCQQVISLRDSDPLYFERPGLFSTQELADLKAVSLGLIVQRNVPELAGALPVSVVTRGLGGYREEGSCVCVVCFVLYCIVYCLLCVVYFQ